jgi:Zn finger protein HypA/HybF involved in hydrogenase expression
MHELSIALEVCRLTEEQVGRERLANVLEVGMDVGDDAGVEIGNLEFCLEALLSGPPFGHGRPAIARRQGDVLQLTYLEVDDDRAND